MPSLSTCLWHKFWAVKVLKKVKLVVWRLCRDLLPDTSKLVMRHVDIPISCPVCNGAPETRLHLFFHCPLAYQVWSLDVFFISNSIHSIDNWLVFIFNSCHMDVISCIFMLIWGT